MAETIWRYMDFTKFVAMLENRGLFFCNLESFGDPFEGTITFGSRERLLQNEGRAEHSRRRLKAARRSTYVSCWHSNEHESEAMWKLYSHSLEGIAIRSDPELLRQALAPHGVTLEPVHYIDYNDPRHTRMELDRVHFFKRKAFEHERELRASFRDEALFERLVARPSDGDEAEDEGAEIPSGRWLPVDLESVVQGVCISPTSEPWIASLLESLLNRYGIRLKVHRSILVQDPAWV